MKNSIDTSEVNIDKSKVEVDTSELVDDKKCHTATTSLQDDNIITQDNNGFNKVAITSITASLCKAMNIAPPQFAQSSIRSLDDIVATSGGEIDRIILFNPDAIAQWIVERFPNIFKNLVDGSDLVTPMLSVFPPKTPVCFASIYSGATPSQHGIMHYEKKRLTIETYFDALIAAGKKPCIVTVAGQSMDILFRGKAMDYFALKNDKAVVDKALELIRQDNYDVICVYNQQYDDAIHRSHPRSMWGKRALRNYVESYGKLTAEVKKEWTQHNSLVGCLTDHGVHREWYLLGNHGKNITKDMNILHFYSIFRATKV